MIAFPGGEVVPITDAVAAVDLVEETRQDGAHTLNLKLTNTTDMQLELAELVPFEVALDLTEWSGGWLLRHGCVSPGDPVAWVSLAPDGWKHPEHDRFFVPFDNGFRVTSETLGGVARPDGSGLFLAFTTADRQATRFFFDVNFRKGTLGIAAHCMLGRVVLEPGETLQSETLLIRQADNLWEAHALWAEELSEHYSALRVKGSRVGWSDWQYYRRDVTQADVLENLEIIKSGDWGIEYILIDDGYQANMSDWLEANERWPGGVSAVIRKILEAGLSPGLWVAPLTASEHGRLPREHPDWLVKGKDGRPLEDRSHMGAVYAIDFSKPEPLEWLKSLIRTIVREWGVKWIKLDGPILRYYEGARFADPKMTAVQVIRRALEAVREATGPDVVIEGEGYYGPSIGLVHTQRVTQDIQTAWPRLRHTTYTNLMSAFMHNRLWTNNPDAFVLRDTPTPHYRPEEREEHVLSDDELRHEVTALALTGGVVMLTDRMSILSPERAVLIRAFIPPYDGAVEPVGFKPGPWEPNTWRLRIRRDFEDWWVVAQFNWTEEEMPFELDLAGVTGEPGRWHVFDFWQRRYLGLAAGVVDGVVRPHGVRLASVRRDTARPQLVGTDIHVTQGGVEIEEMEWDQGGHILRIVVVQPAEASARLFLHVPSTFRCMGGEDAIPGKPDPDGLVCASVPPSRRAELRVRFERA